MLYQSTDQRISLLEPSPQPFSSSWELLPPRANSDRAILNVLKEHRDTHEPRHSNPVNLQDNHSFISFVKLVTDLWVSNTATKVQAVLGHVYLVTKNWSFWRRVLGTPWDTFINAGFGIRIEGRESGPWVELPGCPKCARWTHSPSSVLVIGSICVWPGTNQSLSTGTLK